MTPAPRFDVPRYGARSLAEVLPSVAAAMGLPGFRNSLALGVADVTVVLLVDGLGWESLREHAGSAPFLTSLPPAGAEPSTPWIDACVPTTTSVGLSSLGTGSAPGHHGILGAGFRVGDDGRILWPLAWPDDVPAVSVQPHPTVFEELERWQVDVASVSPADYRTSGLTVAALRGARYEAADDVPQRVAGVAAAVRRSPSVVYVYYSELDRVGHESGPGSEQWRAELAVVDDLAARLAEVLPSGARMIVTADHGMSECPDAAAVDIEALPGIRLGVAKIAGEPRFRHVYARPGQAAAIARRWADALGTQACVLSRDQAIGVGLFGEVSTDNVDRIGDVVALPAPGVRLASRRVDAGISGLPGQHGGTTPQEMRIPLLENRA